MRSGQALDAFEVGLELLRMHTEEPRGKVSHRPYGAAMNFSRLDPGFPLRLRSGSTLGSSRQTPPGLGAAAPRIQFLKTCGMLSARVNSRPDIRREANNGARA